MKLKYDMNIIKGNTIFKILAFCALCTMVSCTSEEKIIPDVPDGTDPRLEVKITFPAAEDGTATKALSDTEEKRIDGLRIFVFTSAGGTDNQLNDKFLYEIDNVPTPTGTGDVKTTTVTIRKMPEKQRLVLVANLPASLVLAPTAGQSLSSLFTSIEMAGSLWRKAGLTASDPAIPMWGQMRDSMLIYTNTGTLPASVEINMFRALARVDVGVDMDNTVSQLITDLKIENIHVCNTGASAYLTPHADYMEGAGIAATVIAKPRPYATKHARETYPVASPNKELIRAIYIPESDILDSPLGNTPAFLVVEATYKGQSGCFYRIDFAAGGSFVPVLRNHAYRMNITAVNSYGYGSLTEAEAAAPSGLSNDLVVEGVNDNLNEIVYNADDFLAINVSEMLFDWDRALVGKAAATAGKDEYTMNLFTTYAKWSASIDSPPSWLRLLNSSSAEVTAITDQTQLPNQQSTFGIRVKEENLTGTEREATITITAGMLVLKVKVRQSGGANSHLIRFKAGETTASVRIPVAFAREALGGTLPALTNATARVLWREVTEPIPVIFTAALDATKTYITVTATSTTGTATEGNAVVALFTGNGIGMVGGYNPDEIVWSWHVWSMADDMDTDFHNPNKDYLMRRGMGKYTSNQGMFYQWGRKDPFPQYPTAVSPRSVSIEAVSASNTASYVIQHPTVFYTGTHWLNSAVPLNRWTENGKAEYNDPCPTGWRVPANNESPEWTASTHLGTGMLGNTDGYHGGTSPFLWLSSNALASAYPFWTASGSTVSASLAAASASGRNVRCIKDIKLVKK